MKPTIVAGALALALALPTAAGADSYSTSGAVSTAGQPSPPSLSVSFTVKTVNGNPKRVKGFKANGIPFTCDNGTTGTTTDPAKLPRRMKVNDKKKFHGQGKLGPTTMVVKGQLKGGGKRAKGTVRIFGPEANTPGVTCDSGHVTWRVRRN